MVVSGSRPLRIWSSTLDRSCTGSYSWLSGTRMPDSESTYLGLQRTYGGKFVALDGANVVASGETYADLIASVERQGLDRTRLIFDYVEPVDALRAY